MLKKVCGIASNQDSGVGWYRIIQPITFLDKITKKKCRVTPFGGYGQPIRIGETESNHYSWNDQLLMEIAKGSDIIWTTLLNNPDEITKVLDLRKWSGAKWIVDIDDNIYAVSNDNAGKKGVEALRRTLELCMSLADGLTVSVPNLKKVYGHLNENIYVNPNATDFSWWKKTEKKHKGIRIGWRGASGHGADIQLIEPAIRKLREKHDIEFVALGVKPPFDCEFHKWVNLLDYPKKLDSMNLDIGVIPLVDSSYNRCKSNVGVQEFSVLKIPVVASPTENQMDLPILFARTNYDWYDQLEKLIVNKELREKQGQEQFEALKEKYNQENIVVPLAKWFAKVPRKII